MPRSKPFSASSLADSCPIPESEAVTMATGLMPSPLVRRTCPPLYAPGVESTNRVGSLRVEVVGIYRGAIERAAVRPSPGVLELTPAHSFLVGVAKRQVSSLPRHRPPPQCETAAPLSQSALTDAVSVATTAHAGAPSATRKGLSLT